MANRKGVCPVCHLTVMVRKDGLIRAHGYLKETEETVACPGTNQEPRISSEGAFSALCLSDDCSKPTAAIVWTGERWDSLCNTHTLAIVNR